MMQCESGETVLVRDSGFRLTAVDRNARRRNNKERNQIFGSNMAASLSAAAWKLRISNKAEVWSDTT